MPCDHFVSGDTEIHICRPRGERKPVPGRRRKRFWCFHCRQHLLHTRMMFDPGPESWYDPNFWWSCERCHEEHILFPGWEWSDA